MDRRAELKLIFKETEVPMGVYQIKNNVNGKIFIGSSLNLQGMINRRQFELKMGFHRMKALQEDWNQQGEAAFSFETLQQFKPGNESKRDILKKLQDLEEAWMLQLKANGEAVYE
jgi:hypothetical protein